MKEGYIIKDKEEPHFITCTAVDLIDILQEKFIKIS